MLEGEQQGSTEDHLILLNMAVYAFEHALSDQERHNANEKYKQHFSWLKAHKVPLYKSGGRWCIGERPEIEKEVDNGRAAGTTKIDYFKDTTTS